MASHRHPRETAVAGSAVLAMDASIPVLPTATTQPRSLAEADDMAARLWPGRNAPASTWLAYHQGRAALFAHAADVDADHHHEALFLASEERELARGYLARLAATAYAHENPGVAPVDAVSGRGQLTRPRSSGTRKEVRR